MNNNPISLLAEEFLCVLAVIFMLYGAPLLVFALEKL